MSTITSTIHEHAVEVDTRLEEAYRQRFLVGFDIEHAEDAIRRSAGQTYDWRLTKCWSGTLKEALEVTEFANPWSAREHAKGIEERTIARAKYAELTKVIDECNADWRAHGCWSRFYLVCNSNGHIHSSVNCTTCYETTNYSWLTNLSGLTEADAVAQEGEILCTICFPSAPVSWTNGVGRRDADAKAKREAEKAERQRKKAEKSLSLNGDVVEIRVAPKEGDRYWRVKEFKTLRSAELWLIEAYAYQLRTTLPEERQRWWREPDAYTEDHVHYIVDLYAQKTGKSVEEVVAQVTAKAHKKLKQ